MDSTTIVAVVGLACVTITAITLGHNNPDVSQAALKTLHDILRNLFR